MYPDIQEISCFKSQGMTILRVPFHWERMQQSGTPQNQPQLSWLLPFEK